MRRIDRTGEKNISNQGYEMTIIEYKNNKNITVKFEDSYIKNTNYGSFKIGQVKNPNFRSLFKTGYIGVGKHVTKINGKSLNKYELWKNMIERCYSLKFKNEFKTYLNAVL